MKLNEAFPSKYLRAADLDGDDATFTIAGAELQTLGQGEDADTKLVLSFHETEQLFVVNKTNANTLESVLKSDDTDDWIDKRITVYPTEVQFKDKMVLSIRVRMTAPKSKAAAAGAGKKTATTPGTITSVQVGRLEKIPGALSVADLKYGGIAELTDLSAQQGEELFAELSAAE